MAASRCKLRGRAVLFLTILVVAIHVGDAGENFNSGHIWRLHSDNIIVALVIIITF